MIYESPVAWLRQEEVLVNSMGQSICQKIVSDSQVNAQVDRIMCSHKENSLLCKPISEESCEDCLEQI